MCCTDKKRCVLTSLKCWELTNLIVYTLLAAFGIFLLIMYSTDTWYNNEGAGLGIAIIICISMGFYHLIFSTTGIYILSKSRNLESKENFI